MTGPVPAGLKKLVNICRGSSNEKRSSEEDSLMSGRDGRDGTRDGRDGARHAGIENAIASDAAANIVGGDRDVIERVFVNADHASSGLYVVRFFVDDPTSDNDWVVICVDDRLPCGFDARPCFARSPLPHLPTHWSPAHPPSNPTRTTALYIGPVLAPQLDSHHIDACASRAADSGACSSATSPTPPPVRLRADPI